MANIIYEGAHIAQTHRSVDKIVASAVFGIWIYLYMNVYNKIEFGLCETGRTLKLNW